MYADMVQDDNIAMTTENVSYEQTSGMALTTKNESHGHCEEDYVFSFLYELLTALRFLEAVRILHNSIECCFTRYKLLA